MSESAVTPEVAIADAEAEPNDIEIGESGTDRADEPNALGNLRLVEARADAEGSDEVREFRRHR